MKIVKIQNSPIHTIFFLDTEEVIAVEKNSPNKEKRIQDAIICDYLKNLSEFDWNEIDTKIAEIRSKKIHIV